MAAWQIPLSGKPTVEAEDPQTIQQRAMTLQQMAQGLAQQKVMGPLQVTAATQENQQRQMQLDQNAALNEGYKNALKIQPDGTASVDMPTLTNTLAQAGHGSAIPAIIKGQTELQKQIADLTETNGKIAEQQANFGGNLGQLLAQAGYDPQFAVFQANHALATKVANSAQIAPLVQQIEQAMAQDPTGATARPIVKQLSDGLIAFSDQQAKLKNEQMAAQARATAAETGQKRLKLEAPGIESKADMERRQNIASQLALAPDRQTYLNILNRENVDHGVFPSADLAFDPTTGKPVPAVMDQVRQAGMSPDQQMVTAGQAAARQQATVPKTEAELALAAKDPKGTPESRAAADEALKRLDQSKIAARPINTTNVTMPGTQEYWVQQLQDNPDSIKEMPSQLRSSVGQAFRKATGLPLPTPLSTTAQASETAARNALDGAAFIQSALKNPEIAAQIGPIMGRLGNAEQAVGTAVGLSPQAEQLAQELRTRMRYFVFQEGKAVLGGRLPQKLMDALESSSANVKMDPSMLQGALNGAIGNAQSVMDNADKQRFGGKMRPATMRAPSPATVTPVSGAPTVKMRAPDGTIKPVPADQVEHFKKLGAVEVK
jgi:hypothetical protein